MTSADRAPNSAADRRGSGCLPPVVVHRVVDEPDDVRAIARANGPYSFPTRPGSLVWPTWRTEWALNGEVLHEPARYLLHNLAFVEAAAALHGVGTERITPHGVYVNLGTPCMAQPVAHTDMPEFRGVDASNTPSWFLQVMGMTRLFEAERIEKVTAVSWFHRGEHGHYSYWPGGLEGEVVRHTDMWNTAVAGDNDFMFHRVERIGEPNGGPPTQLSERSTLECDGQRWRIDDGGRTLAEYADEEVRLSLSWVCRVKTEATATIDHGAVVERLAPAVGDDLTIDAFDDLLTDEARRYLVARWPGYLPVPTSDPDRS